MAKERQEGIQEQMLECLKNMETHLGLIAKNPTLVIGKSQGTGAQGTGAPSTTTTVDAKPTPAKAEPAPAQTEVAPPVTEPTADQVRTVLKDYAENFGRDAAIKLLADKSYKNAGAVPADKRAEFIAHVQSN